MNARNWLSRRALIRASTCLLLGAVINVAVAWALALWLRLDPSGPAGSSTSRDTYSGIAEPLDSEAFREFGCIFITRLKRAGAEQTFVEELSNNAGSFAFNRVTLTEVFPYWGQPVLQFRWLAGERRLWTSRESGYFNTVVDARGWPCLSMMGGVRFSRAAMYGYENNREIALTEERRWIYPINSPTIDVSGAYGKLGQFRWLPLHPIWGGFVINTVCYGSLLWLICGGPLSVRRILRLNRNQCAACGYPVGTSPVCTECGAPLPVPNAP